MMIEEAVSHLNNMKMLKGYDNTSVNGKPLCEVIDDIIALIEQDEDAISSLQTTIKKLCDAIEAAKPHVMSVAELWAEDMGYLELNLERDHCVYPVLIKAGFPDDEGNIVLILKDGKKEKHDIDFGMHSSWRIWTDYPSKALREATPWKD